MLEKNFTFPKGGTKLKNFFREIGIILLFLVIEMLGCDLIDLSMEYYVKQHIGKLVFCGFLITR